VDLNGGLQVFRSGALGSGYELGFEVVRRGYDRGQVDEYVERLLGSTPPTEPPSFELIRRGYDPKQVDTYISEQRARLGLG
jgi:hypothetical protein